MFTWDSAVISFDQTCWTWDGSNDCRGGSNLKTYIYSERLLKRIREEDEEIVLFIMELLQKDVL